MIPPFPTFKKLALSDRAAVEAYTRPFSPYSDFNFTSMWCWDTDGSIQISDLHGNLVVRFLDYVTNEPFYSFIGSSKVTEAARVLLQHSAHSGCGDHLKLIPSEVAEQIDSLTLSIAEDPDHGDYIYPLEKLIRYDGNKLRAKRNFLNRFKKRYTADVQKIDPADAEVQKKIMKLFRVWAARKKIQHTEALNEEVALSRFLHAGHNGELVTTGVFDGDDLIAFAPSERLQNHFAIMHFEKADETYVGIYSYLMAQNARMLLEQGVRYLNFEQDLGLPGLRLSKKSFHPISFLKKYKVSALSTG